AGLTGAGVRCVSAAVASPSRLPEAVDSQGDTSSTGSSIPRSVSSDVSRRGPPAGGFSLMSLGNGHPNSRLHHTGANGRHVATKTGGQVADPLRNSAL